MSSDGIHLLELLLVNITVSARPALGLRNLPTTETVELVCLAIFVFLFGPLFYHLRFNLHSFFPYAVHDFLRLNTEVRFWALKAKIEGRRGHFHRQRTLPLRGCLLGESYKGRFRGRTSHSRKDTAETWTRRRWLDGALVGFAWVHFFHRWLYARRCLRCLHWG